MPGVAPPTYAWDWLARQRLVWQEIRRRLVTDAPAGRPSRRTPPAGDVPDWSRDHPDLAVTVHRDDSGAFSVPRPRRDYRPLDTRAEVIAVLRADFVDDPAVRRVVESVVAEVAFLGRLDVPLHEHGVHTAPRGMRWWWTRLSGAAGEAARSVEGDPSEPAGTVPLQLRFDDVFAGYGDA
jgi:hypothetical protein